jgi:hypothetical protein
LQLTNQKKVLINYFIQSLGDWNPEPNQYDCIALIFLHLPEALRKHVHKESIKALKPGGIIILESFAINQLSRSSGGPKNAELLFTVEQIKNDFADLNKAEIIETQVILDEGPLHQGLADVIRLTGFKPVS